MLSIERIRELLAHLNLTDEEIEDIRTMSWMLAAIAYDAWVLERAQDTKNYERISEGGAQGSTPLPSNGAVSDSAHAQGQEASDQVGEVQD